ncbi:hypothetical protein AB0M36_01760 [Actinoplanes sp. NPDC051346]|uniref:hypothetical protein n=1 Tax=Actinoplanes sp. NPDC051346 TaxID=3155048 RepID=UPI003427D373
MTLPEGWGWLDDLPEEWVPPAEIREPTSNAALNLTIKMLASQILGNDLIELVGMLIAESARYSIWFGSEAKAKVSSNKELAVLSMLGYEQARLVYDAWLPYSSSFGSSGGLVGSYEEERSRLRDSLLNAVSKLSETRKKFEA